MQCTMVDEKTFPSDEFLKFQMQISSLKNTLLLTSCIRLFVIMPEWRKITFR